ASARNLAGDSPQARSTRSRIARVPKGSPSGTASSPIWTSVIGSAVAEGLVDPVRFVLTAGGDDLVAHFVHDRRAVLGHRGNGDRLGGRAAARVVGHAATDVRGGCVSAHAADMQHHHVN